MLPIPGAKPGRGVDPQRAMMLGMDPMMGMGAAPPLPVGGVVPPDAGQGADSPLLAALLGQAGGVNAPAPGMPGEPPALIPGTFGGQGVADPHLGLEGLIQLLALAQSGVGDGGQPGMPPVIPGM